MKVLLIAEDPRKDALMLLPIIRALLKYKGKPRAIVQASSDPRLRGISFAMNWQIIKDIIEENGLYDAFLLCVDRDADSNRRLALDNLESKIEEELGQTLNGRLFIAEQAWQEIEVWLLAACSDLPTSWRWVEIRREQHPKEMYFEEYVKEKELQDSPGQGRKTLGLLAGQQYVNQLRTKSPELVEIEQRLVP